MSTHRTPNSDTGLLVPIAETYEPAAGPHGVQFYATDDFLLDDLARFIGTALGAGESAIVIATKPHRAALAQLHASRGLDLVRAAAQGRYVALDAGETLARFMVAASPDAARFAALIGTMIDRANAAAGGDHPRAAVFGEMVSELWAEGNTEGAVRLERLWNDIATAHSFCLRCAYPMSSFYREEDREPLRRICEQHSHVTPTEEYSALVSDQERQRKITELQQKAVALESEIATRREIERALQRREAELADFLENAVEGVQQVGADQRVRWANPSLLHLLGYNADEYVGRNLAEFHVSRRSFEEFWQRLMQREEIYDFPADLRCRDGSVRHVLIHSNGFWKNGEFVHTRCFIRDVTEHKRMEEALRRSEQVAATGRLAASIAHEINNPLESLTNLFYLLQSQSSLDHTARLYAGMADQELRRISHITRQMLAFYRESTQSVPLNVAEIVDAVLETYHGKLGSKNISVQKQYSTDGIVDGFPFELRQLFANLIGNAIEACPTGGAIRLHVYESCDWSKSGRPGVRVSVGDNGSGIPAASRARVFEPFFTTKAESGTGLGLWVCRGIVQKHEGTIRFRSSTRADRNGTLFSVFLPAISIRR